MNMMRRMLWVRGTVLTVLLIAALVVWMPSYAAFDPRAEELTLTFLDVGQGDAILIETFDGIEVLVDGGANSRVLSELADVLGAFDRTIDMVVATHPDADHIGGLIDVFERYDIDTVLLTENESDTSVNDAFRDGVAAEDTDVRIARRGQTFTLGASTTLRVLYPESDPSDLESNASSIVLKLSFGTTDALLTGDAPERIESLLVSHYKEALQSEILKFGHHGSRTSTSEAFLKVVDPTYGVVSAGADNRYGHPHEEVIDRARLYGLTISKTSEGRVTFVSNGTTIRRK